MSEDLARTRMRGLLEYVEQLIKLDENVARKLDQHRLPDGTQFCVHQHELYGPSGLLLLGLHLDEADDDDGPVWLRIERLTRTRPPAPSEEIADWIAISNDPDKPCAAKDILRRRVSITEKDNLLKAGTVFEDEIQPSLKAEPDSQGRAQYFDLALRLDRRTELGAKIDLYRAEIWTPWAETERPRRKSIALYQKFFEVAQLLAAGNLDQSELIWGIGLSKWRTPVAEVDLPILTRSVEIQILEQKKAEIVVRPRDQAAQIELRAFQALAPGRLTTTENTARAALKLIEAPDGVSPFQPETFEPILKLCSSQLDPGARYLPEQEEPPLQTPVPPSRDENLVVSNRFVLFARRRAMNVVIADIERLKETLTSEGEKKIPAIEGAARTLVLGPGDGIGGDYVPLSNTIGSTEESSSLDQEIDHDHGDLFFPKPFNEDQVQIIRRLEKTDGLVVQGPPGTGKTHTIANIISHMLATGKRVLVISHGETALSVVREQLPPELRDLVISVTTSDRDGERQVEKSASLMLRIVSDFAANNITPRNRISTLEKTINQNRKKLKELDAAIAKIAETQLSAVPGRKETPFDLAKQLMAERDVYKWFRDRPSKTIAQSGLREQEVEKGLAARQTLESDLKYLGANLANIASLPSEVALERWRTDLLRANEIKSSAPLWGETGRIIAKLSVPETEKLLREIEKLISSWRYIQQHAWANEISNLCMRGDLHFASLREQLASLSAHALALGKRAQEFVVRQVLLPQTLPPEEEFQSILTALTEEKNPFGLFAFKLKSHKPSVDQIRINDSKPDSPDDWQHVLAFVVLKSDVDGFFGIWNNICSELGIERAAQTGVPAIRIMSLLFAASLRLPDELAALQKKLNSLVEDQSEIGQVTSSREQLEQLAKALSARISHARLLAVKQQIEEAKDRIPKNHVDINQSFRHLLDSLSDASVDGSYLFNLWNKLVSKLEQLRDRQSYFQIIELTAKEIDACGAPTLAAWIKSEPYIDGHDSIQKNWRAAWDWWALYGYLNNIGARTELAKLHKDRTDAEAQLRSNFADLVRERAFYELAGSMPGTAKSALRAFADLVKRLGKGTGKKAALHRRELRSAMHKCYDAVPCWIMPAWRVSEQVPSEIGLFDLVILDEASQSDAKELPALLRGKKILIVGDDRQVSPTDAFIKQDDIERLRMNYLEEFPFPVHLLPGSSIYDLARVMFPDKFVMLREHFRCVEPIIRFSMQFYDEPLIPLRVPTASERLDPPLIDIYVPDGYRLHKTNPREAEIITDEIEKLINDPVQSHIRGTDERPRSIGVISLIGGDQARFIQQKVIERIGEQKFIEHRVLCGDSATMQGNERDVVFLSMVAEANGRVSAQTAEQYRRRFNVALSRARDRMILVRSIDESRLNNNDLKAKVIQHFRDPMPAAASSDAELIKLCQSGFESEIFSRLSKLGYNVRPQVGSLGYKIDLVVEGSNGRRLAIECDGDKYHGPEKWADDMRRQRILERVGWIFWRVFGSTYSLDPDGVFDDLIQTLDRMEIKPNDAISSPGVWTEHRIISIPENGFLQAGSGTEAPTESLSPTSAPTVAESGGLALGDRVIIRYIDKPDSRPVVYVLTNKPSDDKAGLLNILSPLAKQLAELDVGDEFVFNAGTNEQRILFVEKQSGDTIAAAAE